MATSARIRPRFFVLLSLALLFLAGCTAGVARRAASREVLVVEIPNGPAASAGLQVGDSLSSWSAGDRTGRLEKAWDLNRLVFEVGSRGPVELIGHRAGTPMRWTIDAMDWSMLVGPTAARERPHQIAALAKRVVAPDADLDHLEAELNAAAIDDADLTWLVWTTLRRGGNQIEDARRVALAEFGLSRAGNDAFVRAQLVQLRGIAHQFKGRLAEAEADFRQAVNISLDAGHPFAAVVALNYLGPLAFRKGDLATAEASFRQALEICEREAPKGPRTALAINNMAIIEATKGDALEARKWFLRSLELALARDPGGEAEATAANNLCIVETDLGNLAAAEDWCRRAAEIYGRGVRPPEDLSSTYISLGKIASDRGDWASAETWQLKAKAILETEAPDSHQLATALASLGTTSLRQLDLDDAERWYLEALKIEERINPESLHTALVVHNLGVVATERHRPDLARPFLERALAVRRVAEPGSRSLASTLESIGLVDLEENHLDAAEEHFKAVLAIERRLAPDTADEAVALWCLGRVERKRGRLPQAIELYQLASTALARQQQRLGGTAMDIATFRAFYGRIDRELVDTLVEAGRIDEAFAALEDARARGLLVLLAERGLLDRDLPPELAAEGRQLAKEHEALLAQREAAGEDDAALGALDEKLEDMRVARKNLEARIRSLVPQSVRARATRVADVAAAKAAIGDGGLLVTWSLFDDHGLVFAIDASGLTVAPIAGGSHEIRAAILRLRSQIRSSWNREPNAPRRPAPDRDSQLLADRLLAPIQDRLAKARRLIVVPDGSSWLLPWAMLPDPSNGNRPLIAARPLSIVASATVLGELLAREPARETSIVAFGDPDFGTIDSATLRSGQTLARLPASRSEVAAIATTFPGRSRVFTGTEANEATVHTIAGEASIVHFATHGLVDEIHPLESAIALSSDKDHNGLLHAWEIASDLPLQADLVVLSACDTAIGLEVDGEGLLGISRAFQQAGVRTVLASLWAVSDESTAVLMKNFYDALRLGRPYDEALRHAQLELLNTRGSANDASDPYHWAAFQAIGAWR